MKEILLQIDKNQIMSMRVSGRNPAGKYLEFVKQSANYSAKGFTNLSPTPVMHEDATFFKMAKDFFNKSSRAAPPVVLPGINTDLNRLAYNQPSIVWFGHSSYFLKLHGKTFLVDPVFSGNASPLSFMIKAFAGSDRYTAGDMPAIDYLILTHDHYDHLDYSTLRQLRAKVKKVYCPLGLGSHLRYWGFDERIINEMDWWDTCKPDEFFTLTAAPARHFSGRGIRRGKTLWTSFILKSPAYSIYLGGDSGYDTHFKTIGDKFGPFDIAMLESGQYNTMWPLIHMMPEETVQAASDLKAKMLMPVHWGKFTLAMHDWDEPVQRVLAKASELHIPVTTPMIGELVLVNESYPVKKWWEF